MKSVIERYADQVCRLLPDEHPTCVVYGSSTTGICTSDLDVCILTDHPLDDACRQDLIRQHIAFMEQENIPLDDEVPFSTKLFFSRKEAEWLSAHSPFEGTDGHCSIKRIEKTPEFLESAHMRHRLWINILTTDHLVLCGDQDFVAACAWTAWKKLLEVLLTLRPQLRDASPEDFLETLYRDPDSGAEGEYYLGYKRNNPRNRIHLLRSLYQYLPAAQNRRVNAKQNCNPFFPTPAMIAWLSRSLPSLGSYPEFDDCGLLEEAARLFSIPVENILFTSGAMEGMQIAICTEDDWAIPGPTFWGYAASARINGRSYTEYPLKGAWQDKLPALCAKHDGITLCYPNNPLPQDVEREQLLDLITHYSCCHFLVDESMLPFRESYREQTLVSAVPEHENLTVLLSLSKISGLCGMRGGLVFSSYQRIKEMRRTRRNYTTNTLCQRFFTRYLGQFLDCEEVRWEIREAFHILAGMLEGCPGVRAVIDAEISFLLIEFDADVSVLGLWRWLQDQGIDIMYPYDTYPEVSPQIIRVSACSRLDARRIGETLIRYLSKEVVRHDNCDSF